MSDLKVLLVEDNDGDARLLRELLAEDNRREFDLFHVARLSEALERLHDTSFDAILLDISLPDGRGIDTVRRVRAVSEQVPIVVLTGHSDEAFAINAVREGAQDYLIKGTISGPILARSLRYAIERSHLEAELVQSRKMEAVGNLAAGIAHDFNNILTVIKGHVSLARLAGSMDEVYRSLDEIDRSTIKASELVRELMMFDRRKKIRAVLIDANALIRELAVSIKASLPQSIAIELATSANPLPVLADGRVLERVILNMAFNARDAMPDGGTLSLATARLEITHSQAMEQPDARTGRFGCIRISDTGTGIPPEALSRIFEPFYTTKENDQGTGLGLATSYSIINQLNGWISVDSMPAEGTTFSIYLPLADTEQSFQ